MSNQKIVVAYDQAVTPEQQRLFEQFVADNKALNPETEVEGIGGGIKNPRN